MGGKPNKGTQKDMRLKENRPSPGKPAAKPGSKPAPFVVPPKKSH